MNRWVVATVVVVVVTVAATLVLSSPREQGPVGLRIGSPDDMAGLIVDHMLRDGAVSGEHVIDGLTSFEMKDCCTSRAEWALSSESLDAALMCPDAARRLVEKDGRFVIVGPCLANSDVVLIRDDVEPGRIAVTQNRDYQIEVVSDRFGPTVTTTGMVTSAIPYAYERGAVDGAVLDVLKARDFGGRWLSSKNADGSDRITYVLVVSTQFQRSAGYADFIEAFERSSDELNDPVILMDAIEAYKGERITGEEAKKWKAQEIRFLSTTLAVGG